jgi:hypothetical protein
MSHYEKIHSQLRDAPFLVADGSTAEVSLVTQKEALEIMNKAGLFNSAVIMNVGRALENFSMLVGKEDKPFSLRDIAQMTGVPNQQAYGWIESKVLVPSIRPNSGAGRGRDVLFSWADGFVAGICGALRRQGVRLEMLRKVRSLFIETKQPTRQLATAEQA